MMPPAISISSPGGRISFSARSRWQPIKRRLTARPGWWAWAKAWVATTTKKGNGLVYALQAALDGAIARGEYQQVLARWGEQGEAVAQSVVNPPGITY